MNKSILMNDELNQYIFQNNFVKSSSIMQEMYSKALNDIKPSYNSPISQLLLLKMLVMISSPKTILELGVFRGLSSLAIAEGCNKRDCKIIACDITDEYLKDYKKYWIKAGIEELIDFRIEKADILLDQFIQNSELVDFTYLDANKSQYFSYYTKLIEITRPGGLIVIDNILWKGEVVNKAINNKFVDIMRKLNHFIKNDNRVDALLIPIEDGLWLIKKK